MASMTYRVIYVSDAVNASGDSLPAIAQILGVSDRNNRRDHITGLLVAHRGRFAQVVEGPQVQVEGLVRRLLSDPRHRDLQFVLRAHTAERRFPHWSMTRGPTPPALAAMLETEKAPGGEALLSLLEAAGVELLEHAA